MAYQLINATSIKDLLAKIVAFATAQGWTIDYDDSPGAGGVGGQIALTSGICSIAIGEQTATQNPINVTDTYPNPDVVRQDGRLYAALSTSITVANKRYWGHPGSLVTSATSGERMYWNDLYPSSDEVHFFGNSEYIWIAARTNVDRWTTFGFGLLDTKGMTIPKAAFVCGTYHEWWNNGSANGGAIKASIGTGFHYLWSGRMIERMQLRVPTGILDPALGFPSTEAVRRGDWFEPFFDTVEAQYSKYDGFSETSSMMDMIGQTRNQPTTGGVPLWSCPIWHRSVRNAYSLMTYIGDLPGVRMMDVSDVPIGEGLIYGSVEEWLPFPVKRRTPWVDNPSTAYNGEPSSFGHGYAFLKE